MNIRLNANTGEWDWDTLANEWNVEELTEWGLDIPNFEIDEVLKAEEDDFDVPEGGIETDKLTPDRKAEIIQVLLGIPARNQSSNWLDLKLEEALDHKDIGPQRVLDIIQRDKKRVSVHALVLEAIHKNVLRRDGTAVYYMDDQIGFDIEAAIDYLSETRNQALKAQIIEKLN